MKTIRPGAWAWMGMTSYIIAVDVVLIYLRSRREDVSEVEDFFAPMTEVFHDAVRHPTRRWLTVASWGAVTFHLFKPYLPELMHKFDPITFLANTIYDVGVSRTYEGGSYVNVGNGGKNTQ